MNRLLRQSLVFFGLLLLFTLIRLPYDVLFPTFMDDLKERAKEQRIALVIGESSASFPASVELARIGAQVPLDGPLTVIPLAIDTLRIRLHVLPLLILRAVSDIEVNAYGGSITGTVTRRFSTPATETDLRFSGLDLGQHPVSSLIGLTGVFGGTIAGAISPDPTGSALSFNVTLQNGTYRGGHQVAIIRLPEATDIGAALIGELRGTALDLRSVTLRSSIGDVTGKMRADLLLKPRPGMSGLSIIPAQNISAAGRIALSDEGRKVFGGYLALAAKLPPDRGSTVASWLFDVAQDGRELPRVSVRPAE